MTGTLRVTPEKLISTASSFETTNRNVRNYTNNMLSLINSLTQWQGSAATMYRNKFKQLQGDMNDMYNIIAEHARDLQEMARNYNAGESSIENRISSLQTDVIH